MTDQTSSQTNSDEEVQDAEVVETPTHSTSSNLEERLSIEQMIKNYMSDISRIREKLKTQKDMFKSSFESDKEFSDCLLYTSDAADERSSVDLGGRRIIKKKKRLNLRVRATIIKKRAR